MSEPRQLPSGQRIGVVTGQEGGATQLVVLATQLTPSAHSTGVDTGHAVVVGHVASPATQLPSGQTRELAGQTRGLTQKSMLFAQELSAHRTGASFGQVACDEHSMRLATHEPEGQRTVHSGHSGAPRHDDSEEEHCPFSHMTQPVGHVVGEGHPSALERHEPSAQMKPPAHLYWSGHCVASGAQDPSAMQSTWPPEQVFGVAQSVTEAVQRPLGQRKVPCAGGHSATGESSTAHSAKVRAHDSPSAQAT